MALIRYIPNKFVDTRYEYNVPADTLVWAVYKFTLKYPEFSNPILYKKSAIFVNGKNITQEECVDYNLKDNDVVEITHSIEGPPGLAVAIFFYVAIAAMVGFLFYKMGAYLYSKLPDWGLEKGEADGTQTYDWDGPKSSFIAERPIPLIYGEHLIGGQYINFNVWSDGSDNWADMLLALGEGEIAGVMKDDQTSLLTFPTTLQKVDTLSPYIKINDQFADEFSDGQTYYAYWAGRVGTNKQTSIKQFRNQQAQYDYSHTVPAYGGTPGDQWTTPAHTTNTDIDSFWVKLACPALYKTKDSGKIKAMTLNYRIRHRVASPGGTPGAWVTSGWNTVTKKTSSPFKMYKHITCASRDTWDIQVQRKIPEWTSLSSKKNYFNKLAVTHITEVIDEDLSFPNTALLALRVKATDQISGTFPNVQTLVRGLKVRVPDLGGSREFNDYYWTGTGLDFKKLSDDSDPVTWDGSSYTTQWTSNPAYIIRDMLLNTRYGSGDVVVASGLDDDTIDEAGRKCWQKVTNASLHKNELNIVVDAEQDPQDAIAQMSQVSRLFIFQSGGYIKFKYEEDEDPVQVFSMGNIIKDSFKVDYIDYTKIPNRVEVTYANKDDGWKKNVLEVVDESEWGAGKPKRTQSFSLIGVTSKEQALREAKFLLNKARYVRKGIEFNTNIAACHSEPGDVIAFQHDVPQWGWGGRIIDGHNTATACELDQLVPSSVVSAPTDYDVKVQHSDDSITTASIASVDGKIVRIKSGQSFSPVPIEDDVYIIGKVESTIAEYRIQEMELTPEEEVQIRATEHNANIYSDTGLEISSEESTELPNPSAFAPQVTDLNVYELYNANAIGISFRQPETGRVGDAITLTDITNGVCTTTDTQGLQAGDKVQFTSGDFNGRVFDVNKVYVNSFFTLTDTSVTDSGSPGVCYKYRSWLPMVWDHADIYISTDNQHFEKKAEGYGDDDIEYYNVFPGETYYVKAYSINYVGVKNPSPVTASITFKGINIGRPAAPTGLEVFGQGNVATFAGRDCKIGWRLNAPFGGAGSLGPELPTGISPQESVRLVKDFIVQVWTNTNTASNIAGTRLREEIAKDKFYVYTYEKNYEDNNQSPEGNLIFRVYQRNYYDKVSEQYAQLAANSDTPDAPTGLSATSEEDGVSFVWNDVSDSLSDFSHYEYRTQVDSGGWSSWQATYGSSTTRWLNAQELASQKKARFTVEAEVRVLDVFNATSASSSTSASCNNFKGFFTVSPTTGQGHYTTVASAVYALTTTGGTILLKEGTHTIDTDGILLPDQDYTIMGENKLKTVVVASSTGYRPFRIYGSKSSAYVFKDFTCSFPKGDLSGFIDVNPQGALNTNTTDLMVTNIYFKGEHPLPNSVGVAYRGDGSVTVRDSKFTGVGTGVQVYGRKCVVENNNFEYNYHYGVYLWGNVGSLDTSDVSIQGNLFDPYYIQAIKVAGADALIGGRISNNTCVMSTATGGKETITGSSTTSFQQAFDIDGMQKTAISNNTFISVNASKLDGSISQRYHLRIGDSENLTITGNTILASLDNGGGNDRFIHLSASCFSNTISGNSGELRNASSVGNWYGIYLIDSDRNIISDNNIRMNNRSLDYGILLVSDTEYNYGRGNLVWDAAYGVWDGAPASNDVIATLS